MRTLLALAAVLGAIQVGATTVEIPAWLTVLAPLITSGGFLAWYTARVEKRIKSATADKSEAETEEVYQRLYQKLGGTLAKTQADLETLQADLAAADAKLEVARAERAAIVAERNELNTRIEIQKREIDELRAELETTRAELGLLERRDPPGPLQP